MLRRFCRVLSTPVLITLTGLLPLAASPSLATEPTPKTVSTPSATSPSTTPAPPTPDNSKTTTPDATNPPANAVKEVTWDDLIPQDYRPETVFAQMDVNSLQDGDPKAAEAMEKLRSLWKDAPVVKELDGRKIKLGGFAVPLDGDGKITTEFLLVPYYGACIHVPPPPANQAILISLDKPQTIIEQPFDAVWVEGVIKIERFSNDLADAGYAMKNAVVTPYEE